jgi:release factor glutamine methyltransferase
LPLRLSPPTLVPRADTETLVEAALELVRSDSTPARPLRIADLGTGSGAILLALLSELPGAVGIGTDLSEEALRTARDNAGELGLLPRAAFAVCDYAAALAGPFDLIVSNPPYIRSGEIALLDAEVRDHDPHGALDGGDDGLDAYRRLASRAAGLLARGGWLVVEVGHDQAEEVQRLLAAAGLTPSGVRRDLAGICRVVMATSFPG